MLNISTCHSHFIPADFPLSQYTENAYLKLRDYCPGENAVIKTLFLLIRGMPT